MSDEIMNSVRETCILASVSCSSLGMTRTDKEASTLANEQHGAAKGAGRVVVSRLPGADEHHKAIVKAQREAVQGLKDLSMKWGNEEGWRLLPNRNFNDALGRVQAAKINFDAALMALRTEANEIIDRAKANMGTYNIDIPSADELVNSYSLTTEFSPVPVGAQFRGLPDSTIRKLSAAHEARVAACVEESQTDVLRRTMPLIEQFIERMQAYDIREARQAQGEEVGRTGVFRDSVVENIKDLFDAMTAFNVTGDPRITELQNMMASLAATSPKDLRDLPLIRRESVTRATEIVDNLNDWLSPPVAHQEAAE